MANEENEEIGTKEGGTAEKSPINEAKQKIVEFCMKEFGREPTSVRFLKLSQTDMGWTACVEITEENLYLKKLGYPPVFDRHVYNIDLDGSGRISGFSDKSIQEE